MSLLAGIYREQIVLGFKQAMQYRVGLTVWIIGLAVEPIVYLVVWRTVAEARGGAAGGFSAGDFEAYYIVWIVVRVMNIALTPWAFEDRVQRGGFSPMLLRPVHPFHLDLGNFISMKLVALGILAPIVLTLTLLFEPNLSPTAGDLLRFGAAIWSGFVMRFVLVWALGLITFWVVRVSAIFDLYFAAELLLSGRLVPMALLPPGVRDVAYLLPFHWSFGFPIELALGRLSGADIVGGFVRRSP